MAWLPRSEVLSYEELARIARICVERFGLRRHPDHGRRAHGPGPPAPAVRAAAAARGGPGDDHERGPAARAGPRPGRAGLRPGERLARHPPPRDVPGPDPPRRARPGPRRHRRGPRRRPRPGEDERRRDPGGQRPRGRGPRPLRARAGRRRAVHRVHAARRPRRLDDGPGRPVPGDPRADRRRLPAGGRHRAPAAHVEPAVRIRLPGRDRGRRGHRQRDGAVLRPLRPGPGHGRGQVPDLPVRPGGDRPAGGPARTAGPTTTSPGRSRRPSAPSGPGTGSGRSASSAPPAR